MLLLVDLGIYRFFEKSYKNTRTQKRPLIVEKWLSVSVGKCKSALENRELIAYNKKVITKKF